MAFDLLQEGWNLAPPHMLCNAPDPFQALDFAVKKI
jgi:hypothetical protein